MVQREIWVRSTCDNSLQPSLFYRASKHDRPLLVGLHTWSHDRFNQINNMLPYAERYDFHLLLPEFRGSNLDKNSHCTDACGSVLAKQDIKDAIDYVIANENIDRENIFLLGFSGGGHMALLMAGYCPTYFKAIGSCAPITDLALWAEENKNYRQHVLACCQGNTEEMRLRSPMTYCDTIATSTLKIFHGKSDSVVPVTHSLRFFQTVFERHSQAKVYLDIFDGDHEIDMEPVMYWLLSQYEKKEKTRITG